MLPWLTMLFLHFPFVLKNRILELEFWKYNLKKPKAYAVKFIHIFLTLIRNVIWILNWIVWNLEGHIILELPVLNTLELM